MYTQKDIPEFIDKPVRTKFTGWKKEEIMTITSSRDSQNRFKVMFYGRTGDFWYSPSSIVGFLNNNLIKTPKLFKIWN